MLSLQIIVFWVGIHGCNLHVIRGQGTLCLGMVGNAQLFRRKSRPEGFEDLHKPGIPNDDPNSVDNQTIVFCISRGTGEIFLFWETV